MTHGESQTESCCQIYEAEGYAACQCKHSALVLGTLLTNCTTLSWLWILIMTSNIMTSLQKNILVILKLVHCGIPNLSLVPFTCMLTCFC